MDKFVYTIYDKIAQETGPLMIFNNDDHAIRVYPQAFKNQENPRYSDFMLCCLGTIDIRTMRIFPLDVPKDITPEMGGQ